MNTENDPDAQQQKKPTNCIYILQFSNKIGVSLKRGDVEVRHTRTKAILFFFVSQMFELKKLPCVCVCVRVCVCVCVCKGNPPPFYVKKLLNIGPRAGLGPTEVGQIRNTYDKV